ncbi:MAG TPA: NAD(P)-dependent oxidoreductase [Bradyrhizobium sp.]|nr:NAD(P)-dependent oxidoreductase [Bradyrhizobium sp.]
MRMLVFGGAGQAGNEFVRIAGAVGVEILAPSHAEVDVRCAERVFEAIAASKADAVVNLTAFHVLEECERSFLDALAVNAAAVRTMAQASRRSGARLMTVSTDYVFNGRAASPYDEEAPPKPIQAYGISKLAGELGALAEAGDLAFVARTCGLYGRAGSRSRGGNFVERRLTELAANRECEVGSDLRCTPTSARAFAEALFALATKREVPGGIYHLTCEGDCSWAEFTEEIARQSHAACRVIGVDRRGDYGPVRRPAYSVLANRKAAALGIRLPHWSEDLARYLAERDRGSEV